MLLSSSMPFYGKDRMRVVKRILNNKYAFKGRRWIDISDDAKDFITALLVADPEERMNAETALQSAWLKNYASPSPAAATPAVDTTVNGTLPDPVNSTPPMQTVLAKEEELAHAAMLRYATYPKLKKMVRACVRAFMRA